MKSLFDDLTTGLQQAIDYEKGAGNNYKDAVQEDIKRISFLTRWKQIASNQGMMLIIHIPVWS